MTFVELVELSTGTTTTTTTGGLSPYINLQDIGHQHFPGHVFIPVIMNFIDNRGQVDSSSASVALVELEAGIGSVSLESLTG